MSSGVGQRELTNFRGEGYDKGRSRIVQALWLAVSSCIVTKWWCPNRLRVQLLRWFGGKIGNDVIIRSDVTVHWPWKLTVGDSSWIGQKSWLLNLEPIEIGNDVCISQGALLCTGSHDRFSPSFEFDNAPIRIEDGAWIAARAVVLRGVTVGAGTTIGAGVVLARSVGSGRIVRPLRNVVD